jgi:hypothetical protein
MIRHKWIIGVRNKLATLWGECDSCAAIEGARMTKSEREKLQSILERAVRYIDKQLPKPKK